MMTSDDVLRVLDLLEGVGVNVWLDGGWGVDALLREQTRHHNDLDIVMKHDDVHRFMQAMEGAGFRRVEGGTPTNFVVVDGEGREVDVHLVDLDSVGLDGQGIEVYGPNGLAYEVGCLEGIGMVLGRRVACCTAEYQIKSHTGYEPNEDDFRDVLALHERFGLALPPPFEPDGPFRRKPHADGGP